MFGTVQDEAAGTVPVGKLECQRKVLRIQQRITGLRDLQPASARAQVPPHTQLHYWECATSHSYSVAMWLCNLAAGCH